MNTIIFLYVTFLMTVDQNLYQNIIIYYQTQYDKIWTIIEHY